MNISEDLDKTSIEKFCEDPFAVNTVGAEIISVKHNYSLCRLKIEEKHRNVAGGVMGGVYFTLADFAFAVAVNSEEMNTVTVSANIDFLNFFRDGEYVYAETKCRKEGKRISFYQVLIKDENNVILCECQFVGFKVV